MLQTLEIMGSAFVLDPCDALFGPGGPVGSVDRIQTVSVAAERQRMWWSSWQTIVVIAAIFGLSLHGSHLLLSVCV